MSVLYRVDLTRETITAETVKEKYQLLGGRALTSTIVSEEVRPTCHPLSKENKLVIAPGLISGTILSSSNRLSVGSKSPLTNGIKESNAGGNVAIKLGKLGIKAIIIEGKKSQSAKSVLIVVSKSGIEIEDASFIEGLNAYPATEKIKEKYGKKVGIMVIGKAGELMLASSQINVTDKDGLPGRSLGRGGLGAVMGSKNIKAIVVDDAGVTNEQNKKLNELIKVFAKKLRENPVTGDIFGKYGTARNIELLNELKGLPTYNFSSGTFDYANDIGGEKINELISKRAGESKVAHACMPGCVIRCSKEFYDENGDLLCQSLEYETLCLLGSNIGLKNIDQIAELNKLCDDIGLDTMDVGVSLGVLTEAGVFKYGDFNSYKSALQDIGNGTPLGRLIASGPETCGKVYGVIRVAAVNGQGMAAYDPRVIKGLGVTYATSPMGADHTAGNTIVQPIDHRDPEIQIKYSKETQINFTLQDSLGMCILAGRITMSEKELMEDIIENIIGKKVTIDNLKEQGLEIIKLEREFNKRAGISEQKYRIPDYMKEEELEPTKEVFVVNANDMDKIFD